MRPVEPVDDFSGWVEAVRQDVAGQNTEAIPIFNMYANEALFGRRWIDVDLKQLPKGAAILELGAGLLLLSIGTRRILGHGDLSDVPPPN